jgi:anti-sigma factor RsiW
MTHVTALLAAHLGGELDQDAARAVEAHLSECADCRAEAGRLRATWDVLATAAVPPAATRADLWSGVQVRTTGQATAGWFFGRSNAVRASLALATVALGVMVGHWTGTLGGPAGADGDSSDDSSLAGVWLQDSTWDDQASGGLSDSWLALADVTDSRQAAGNGGTK